jgi:hypothetical protein
MSSTLILTAMSDCTFDLYLSFLEKLGLRDLTKINDGVDRVSLIHGPGNSRRLGVA